MTYYPRKYENYPFDNQKLGERAGLESIPRYLTKDSVECVCSNGPAGEGLFAVNFHPKVDTTARYFELFSRDAQIILTLATPNVTTTAGSTAATLSNTNDLAVNTTYIIYSNTIPLDVLSPITFTTGNPLSTSITLSSSSGVTSGTSAAKIGKWEPYAVGVTFELNVVDFYSETTIKDYGKSPATLLNTSSTLTKIVLPFSNDTTELPIRMRSRYLYSLTAYCSDSNTVPAKATFLGRSIQTGSIASGNLGFDMTKSYSTQTNKTALTYNFIPYCRIREVL